MIQPFLPGTQPRLLRLSLTHTADGDWSLHVWSGESTDGLKIDDIDLYEHLNAAEVFDVISATLEVFGLF